MRPGFLPDLVNCKIEMESFPCSLQQIPKGRKMFWHPKWYFLTRVQNFNPRYTGDIFYTIFLRKIFHHFFTPLFSPIFFTANFSFFYAANLAFLHPKFCYFYTNFFHTNFWNLENDFLQNFFKTNSIFPNFGLFGFSFFFIKISIFHQNLSFGQNFDCWPKVFHQIFHFFNQNFAFGNFFDFDQNC